MTLLKNYRRKLNKFIIDIELGSVSFGETESESNDLIKLEPWAGHKMNGVYFLSPCTWTSDISCANNDPEEENSLQGHSVWVDWSRLN